MPTGISCHCHCVIISHPWADLPLVDLIVKSIFKTTDEVFAVLSIIMGTPHGHPAFGSKVIPYIVWFAMSIGYVGIMHVCKGSMQE
jgi:hypothetical protein